ncbi:MAG: glycosyltransferase [Vicinamibacterales bacterium]
MRVLVVVHGFPPLAQGGAEIYAHEHAQAITRTFGDQVHVLTREQDVTRPEYAVRTERRDNLTITWVNNTFRSVRTFEDSYRNAPIGEIAARLVDEYQPDVAHLHHLTCLSTEIVHLLAARGIPTVFTLHDYWLMCHRGQLFDVHGQVCAGPEPSGCHSCLGLTAVPAVPSRLVPTLRSLERRLPGPIGAQGRRWAAKLTARSAGHAEHDAAARRFAHMQDVCDHVTQFLAPSRSIRDRFIQFGVDPGRISLAPYGFDHHRFVPAKRIPSPRLRLGFLGSLMVSKGPHLLLEAYRRLPPCAATVDLFGAHADYHGDTSYRHRLEPLLSLPGVRIHGPRPHAEVPDALASLDALVVTSVWPETSPLVVREALLSGLPVVASRVGGIPEVVAHELNGLLFEPGHVDDLCHMLTRLLNEPGLLHTLAAGAIATSIRTLENDVAATRSLYRSLVDSRPAVRRPQSRLAAVVLNYRTADDTVLAVSSLAASDRCPDQIVVVDNDVSTECQPRLSRFGALVTYLHTGRNLGFSGGMNVGIRAALDSGAERVLLVNSDVVLAPDCLERLDDALAPGRGGIAGPLVVSRSMPDVVASAGIDYNPRSGRMRHRDFGASVTDHARTSGERAAVSGCLMLITRDVFDRIGLLDERYFFSFEEIDFCLRARKAGFPTQIVAGAVAYHEGGRAIGVTSPRRLYFAARNHLLMASAIGATDDAVTRACRTMHIAALCMAHAARSSGGSLLARLVATARGIRDHARGRYGPDSSV